MSYFFSCKIWNKIIGEKKRSNIEDLRENNANYL